MTACLPVPAFLLAVRDRRMALTWYERSALMADEWNSLCALIFIGARCNNFTMAAEAVEPFSAVFVRCERRCLRPWRRPSGVAKSIDDAEYALLTTLWNH